MNFLSWLKSWLACEQHPDLIIAVIAGFLAMVLTILLRALLG
jgi:hypothetical protein